MQRLKELEDQLSEAVTTTHEAKEMFQEKEKELSEATRHLKEANRQLSETKSALEREQTLTSELEQWKITAEFNQNKVY